MEGPSSASIGYLKDRIIDIYRQLSMDGYPECDIVDALHDTLKIAISDMPPADLIDLFIAISNSIKYSSVAFLKANQTAKELLLSTYLLIITGHSQQAGVFLRYAAYRVLLPKKISFFKALWDIDNMVVKISRKRDIAIDIFGVESAFIIMSILGSAQYGRLKNA